MKKILQKILSIIPLLINSTSQFCGSYPALTRAEGFNQDRGAKKDGQFDFPSTKITT